jgi:D-amino peptidase
MKICGLTVPLVFPERPFKPHSRLLDLYWVTHLYLLDTRYFHAPLRGPKAREWTEELLGAVPWVLEERRLDLAGEVAFCLQAAGAAGSGEHRRLLEALARAQQPDGRVVDLTLGEGQASQDEMNHTTAAALIAFAGAEERRPGATR